jgi:Holliday junction DNA helicase RuvB
MDNDYADDFGADHGHMNAMAAGAAYALYRHGQDRQTAQLLDALQQPPAATQVNVNVHLSDEDPKGIAPVNALDHTKAPTLEGWDDFVGQDPLKRQLLVHINAAQALGVALPHVLLASGRPGIGKTTMARLIAKTLDVNITELVPPFNIWTLSEAAQGLYDNDILFIDEIHILANHGKRGAEILLKALEDKTLYLPDGSVIPLDDITIIGATTDKDMLPETIIDRFKIKPYFQPYSIEELGFIAVDFSWRHHCLDYVEGPMALTFAQACRGTPRVLEEMVLACRDLTLSQGGTVPTPEQVLEFLEVEPDGLTRTHVHYLTAMYQYFMRVDNKGRVEYIAGEATMQQILRETKQGIGRVERHLVEQGLLDRTPRGRRLTDLGIDRAMEFIAAGKGAADIA